MPGLGASYVTSRNSISTIVWVTEPLSQEPMPPLSSPHDRCALCGRADAMPSKAPRGMKREECALNHRDGSLEPAPDAGAELSGTGARKIVERMLLHKVDIRMLILIPIYIPNHVSCIL